MRLPTWRALYLRLGLPVHGACHQNTDAEDRPADCGLPIRASVSRWLLSIDASSDLCDGDGVRVMVESIAIALILLTGFYLAFMRDQPDKLEWKMLSINRMIIGYETGELSAQECVRLIGKILRDELPE